MAEAAPCPASLPLVQLRLLGCPELRIGGEVVACADRQLRLLAVLATDGPQDRLQLADLLWDGTSERVLHNLRMALLQLRRTLGRACAVLGSEHQTLWLDREGVHTDTEQLESGDAQTLLRAWSGEFMCGHRSKGTENWLDWANRAEQRLLEAHVGSLVAQAIRTPRHLTVRLIRQAQTLLPEYPVPPMPLPVPPAQRQGFSRPDWLIGQEQAFAALSRSPEARHLYGPPGSGRTSLARAAWGDAHWITGSQELREIRFGAVAASLGGLPLPAVSRAAGETVGRWVQLDALEKAITSPSVVLDDLDLLDLGTLQLGAYLLRRGRRVLFISRGQHLPEYLRDVPRLELRPLSDPDLLELARRMAPGLLSSGPELLPDLKALTGGWSGLLTRLLRGQPAALQDAVRQRLHDLNPTEQHLLAAAHLLRCHRPQGFQDHLTLSAQQYARAADHLTELHFWQDDQLTHPLLGPLALERLSWRQRRELQELSQQTAIRSVQTGMQQSLSRGDPGGALAQVRRVDGFQEQASLGVSTLEVSTLGAASLTALKSMEAVSAMQLGLALVAEQAARESLHHGTRGHDAALALDVLANLAIEQGQYQLAERYSSHALKADPDASEDLYYTAAYLADLLGDHLRAEKTAHLGLRRLGPEGTPALLYAVIASTHDAREQFGVARHWHELALHAARAQGSPVTINEVLSFYLWHLNVTGGATLAKSLAQAALSSGEFGVNSYLRNSLGIALYHLGDLDRAHDILLVQQQSSNPALAAIAHTQSALIYHRQGERERAHDLLVRSQPFLQQTEAGRPRYEWAVAALTLNPGEWSAEAQRYVQGVLTNDSVIRRTYQQLRASLMN